MILYFIFILFSFYCYVTFGIIPPTNQLDALNSIVQKFNLSSQFGNDQDYCLIYQCDPITGSLINSLAFNSNIAEYTPVGAKFSVSDLLQFTSVNSISLNGFEIEYDLIYNKIPDLSGFFLMDVRGSMVINQTLANYENLYIDSKDLEGTDFKLSYIGSQTILFFLYGAKINLILDVPKPKSLQTLTFKTKNLSDFKKISIDNLQIYMDQDFNTTSLLENYKTIGSNSISLLKVDSASNNLILPSEFLRDRLVSRNYYRDFLGPSFFAPVDNKPIDLSTFNYARLQFNNAGPSFNIQINSKNVFPILTSNTTTYLIFNNGSISQVNPLSQFGKASLLSVTNCNIGGELGPYEPNDGLIRRLYDFSDNHITGTIDPSWCNSLLIVKNNRMNGTIPTCFSCYFQYPMNALESSNVQTYYQGFLGNNFDNLDLNIKCTTFEPQVERIADRILLFYGNDIGFDGSFILINDQISCGQYVAIEFGKSYQCLSTISFKDLKYIKINFQYPFNKDYYFSLIKRPPIISSVSFSNNILQVNGSFFASYLGHVTQLINFSDSIFEILDSSDFFSIQAIPIATLVGPTEYTFDLITLSTNSMVTRVYINSSTINNKPCPNDCTDDDHGICNLYTGGCVCFSDYIGDDCSLPNFFITSVQPSTTNGGEAVFFGSFLQTATFENTSLTIGGLDCPITFDSLDTIKCNAPPGNGIKTVVLKQNNKEFTGVGIYKYIELSIPCPNKCSNNGLCNSTTGICKCNNGYTLFDCSALINTDNGNNPGGGTNTTIDPGTGSTNITSSQTHFQIYLKSLIEVDINNKEVKSYSLLKNWIFNKTENEIEPNKYILKQQLINNNSSNSNGCMVTSTIEEIKDKNGKEFTFAGTSFIVSSGSIKFTISISNYTYQNNLNTLKLELISSVDKIDTIDNCNSKDTEIDTSNVNDLSTFNYIKISKNNKIFSGRFINKVMSDGRSTFFTTNTRNDSNSIIVTLNLPHCTGECLIDPDFSVLVSNDFKSECNDDSSRKWLIPIVVIIPILGATLIFIVFFILYRKSTTIKIIIHASKLKKLNNK
ncbi:hypothetical protein ACTFIV_007727 [Dictyostelium citrinum]